MACPGCERRRAKLKKLRREAIEKARQALNIKNNDSADQKSSDKQEPEKR